MHEATRTFCCRAGFLFFALVPTLFVGGWIVVRASPRYASMQEHRWERTLARTLGLFAEIERIENPAPSTYILHGVKLTDPDAERDAEPLLVARRVELAPGPAGLVILATEGELDSAQLPRLWSILHERLLRGPEVASTPVRVSLNDLKFGSHALADVRLQLTSDPKFSRGAVEFRLAGSSGDPARLSVERLRGYESRGTKWAINTGATPLPCPALAACMPALGQLGEDCTFHGIFEGTWQDETYDAALSGTFAQLDLQTLVSQQLPEHYLTGRATVTISEAHWRGGQLTSAAGGLRASGGQISPSFWSVNALQLDIDPQLRGARENVSYRELAFGFQMQPRSLRLSGACLAPGVILTDTENHPLIYQSRTESVHPVALVQALLPNRSPYEGRRLDFILPPDEPVQQASNH